MFIKEKKMTDNEYFVSVDEIELSRNAGPVIPVHSSLSYKSIGLSSREHFLWKNAKKMQCRKRVTPIQTCEQVEALKKENTQELLR